MTSLAEFADGVMPVGEYVPLQPGLKYYAIAQGRGIWMGALARVRGLPKKVKFIPEFGYPFEIDGDMWSEIIVFSLSQGQNAGLTTLNVVLQTGGNFQIGLTSMFGQDFNANQGLRGNTLIRTLEYIAPIGGSESLFQSVLIASGGADVTGTFAVSSGDLLSIDWSITLDASGTTPHASYIGVKDAMAQQLLYALGEGNASGTKLVRVQGTGNLTFTLHNGDTVSHTFLLNIYRMVA